MNKAISIWLFLLLIGFQAFGTIPRGLKPGVDKEDLVVSVRAPRSVTPGKLATFILEVKNEYDFPLALKVNIDKPDSWTLLSRQSQVNLEIGESQNIVFLMEIDRACEIGDQVLNFDFYDKEHDVRLKEQIVTEVENIHKLIMRPIRVPRYVSAGERFEVDFEIQNLGNCIEDFELSSFNGDIVNRKITLSPNSTTIITVKERAPRDVKRVSYINSGILLAVKYQDKKLTTLTTIKVYPKATAKSDKFHRLPIEASLIYFGAQTNQPYVGSFQGELKGKGFIDQNKRHELDFTFRAPNRFSIARVGNFDQYSAEYTYHKSRLVKTNVRVGDFAYNLTQLTELYRWARGVGITHTNNKVEVGGFFNSPRFIGDIQYQYALFAKYNFTSRWNTQLSAHNKFFFDSNDPALIFSVSNAVSYGKNGRFTSEVSRSTRNGQAGYGAQLGVRGSVGKLTYSTENIYTDKNFQGFYTNSIFSNTALRYRLRKVSFNASFFYNESNPTLDTLFTVSPYSLNYRAGFSYYPSQYLRTQTNYIYRFREDRFPDKKFLYREHGLRHMMNLTRNTFDAQLLVEILSTTNLLVAPEDNNSTSYLAGFTFNKTINDNLGIGGFTQYLYTNRYASDNQSLLFYGGNVRYSISDIVKLKGSYSNNYLLEEYTTDRTLLDASVMVDYRQHKVELIASQALSRNTVGSTNFFFRARYTCQIGVPTQRKEGLYTLDGQVKAANPRDAAGIIINVAGQSVMTDEYGHFVINDLPEGIHYLYIDNGSIAPGLVADIETPYELFIYPNQEHKLVFNVFKEASLTGKIDFVRTKVEEFRNDPLPIKIVKATKGNQELLTYSDKNGEFKFNNLVPGKWKIRIVNHENSNYTVTTNNQVVDLNPAQAGEISFEMKKKQRNIKFSDKVLDLNIKKN